MQSVLLFFMIKSIESYNKTPSSVFNLRKKSKCNKLDFWGLMSINKGAHFDKDFKDTPVFEKMMVTSVDTDELLFPCIVY